VGVWVLEQRPLLCHLWDTRPVPLSKSIERTNLTGLSLINPHDVWLKELKILVTSREHVYTLAYLHVLRLVLNSNSLSLRHKTDRRMIEWDSPSFVRFCSMDSNVVTRSVVAMRRSPICFFLVSSTVEFFRIRPRFSIPSTLRTSDHRITRSITSKTMARAAPNVATRFEIRDISAIPTGARASIRPFETCSAFPHAIQERSLVYSEIYIYIYIHIHVRYISPRDRSRIDLTARQSIIPSASLDGDYRGYSEAFESRESLRYLRVSIKPSATGRDLKVPLPPLESCFPREQLASRMQRRSAQRPLKNARISSRVLVLSLSKDLDHTACACACAYRAGYSVSGRLEEWKRIALIVRSRAYNIVIHSLVQHPARGRSSFVSCASHRREFTSVATASSHSFSWRSPEKHFRVEVMRARVMGVDDRRRRWRPRRSKPSVFAWGVSFMSVIEAYPVRFNLLFQAAERRFPETKQTILRQPEIKSTPQPCLVFIFCLSSRDNVFPSRQIREELQLSTASFVKAERRETINITFYSPSFSGRRYS